MLAVDMIAIIRTSSFQRNSKTNSGIRRSNLNECEDSAGKSVS